MNTFSKNTDLEDNASDELTAQEIALLRQKLDRDRQQKWAAKLAQQGTTRTTSTHFGTFFLQKNWRNLAVAASLLLGLASALWLWERPSPAQKNVQVATNGLPHFTFQGNLRGQNDAQTAFKQAVKAYETGQFDKALAIVAPLETNEKGWETTFLAGLCHISKQTNADFEQSIPFFDQARHFAGAPIEIEIYRAFALKKIGKNAEARTALEKLRNHPQLRATFAETVNQLLEN
jgi:hypothetical protein